MTNLKAWGALVITVMIWASFLVSTRAAVTTPLGAVDVGLMRFGTAAILFAPIWLQRGVIPPQASLREVVLVALVGGFVFILLLSNGLRFAPVADSGVFAPSMLPLFVAILSFFFLGERFTGLRLIGFAMILIGALSIGGWEAMRASDAGAWRGHILFLAGSFCWAVYTVSYRRSGMGALDAAAMIAFWSALGFAILALFTGTSFAEVPLRTILLQLTFQGVLSGFVATFTFGYAVTRLGASRTTAFAALVPVLAAIGGWVFLDEAISPAKALGIFVVSCGVALASGAISSRKRIPQD